MTTEPLTSQTRPPPPSFAELFTPKLATVLREGYGGAELRRDAFAGLTVAVIALPLSMAIAVASGVAPERGLYAAIIGGFVVSALGGSRFQIGGPAGAFIGIVAAAVARHGVDGLLLATFLSGLMLAAAGFLRVGTFIRLVPYPVTVGFTAGIAILIFASQVKDLFGLSIPGSGAHDFIAEIGAAAGALSTFNPQAAALAAATIAIIAGLQKIKPGLPAMLIAIAFASLAAELLSLSVETIGSRFGGLPGGVPAPALPPMTAERIIAVMPDAFAFALLGAIESLLSATVADGMTGRRHRSNCELVAQGAANIASSLCGGIVVTGTVARTATNVRAGAHGPAAGMLHSVFLLAFLLAAAPLAAFIPLCALAGVLAVVAWRMLAPRAIASLARASRGDAAAVFATLLLTVFRDLTQGIIAGVAVASLAFMQRMSASAGIAEALVAPDAGDGPPESRTIYEPSGLAAIGVYRVRGALFFGSAASLAAALGRIIAGRRALILDFSEATLVDSTGADAVRSFVETARRKGVRVRIAGARPDLRAMLAAHGVAGNTGFDADIGASLGVLRDVEGSARG